MPKSAVKKIISLQSKFFCSKGNGKRGLASVSWNHIQLPKEAGGLGVDDLLMKNAAMLFKWWWCFSVGDKPLWKRIVCSCNDLDMGKPVEVRQIGGNLGGLWNSICSIWKIDKAVESIVKNGLWVMVGNGRKTFFWEDKWIGDKCLMNRFPRLYSISSLRNKVISECGFYDGYSWNWNLLWRRWFFEWEQHLF